MAQNHWGIQQSQRDRDAPGRFICARALCMGVWTELSTNGAWDWVAIGGAMHVQNVLPEVFLEQLCVCMHLVVQGSCCPSPSLLCSDPIPLAPLKRRVPYLLMCKTTALTLERGYVLFLQSAPIAGKGNEVAMKCVGVNTNLTRLHQILYNRDVWCLGWSSPTRLHVRPVPDLYPLPPRALRQGGGRKKFLVPPWHFFFRGYPQRGGGGAKIKFCENFPGSKNLGFLEIHPNPLSLGGARRILFKVSIDILADMGGIGV